MQIFRVGITIIILTFEVFKIDTKLCTFQNCTQFNVFYLLIFEIVIVFCVFFNLHVKIEYRSIYNSGVNSVLRIEEIAQMEIFSLS